MKVYLLDSSINHTLISYCIQYHSRQVEISSLAWKSSEMWTLFFLTFCEVRPRHSDVGLYNPFMSTIFPPC